MKRFEEYNFYSDVEENYVKFIELCDQYTNKSAIKMFETLFGDEKQFTIDKIQNKLLEFGNWSNFKLNGVTISKTTILDNF